MNNLRNWKYINQQLVNRGRPSTYILPAIQRQNRDLQKMNKGKVGKPYRFSDILIIAGFAIKTIFKIGYREAAGNVSDYLSMNMIKESPDFRTMQWRISKMEKEGIKFMIYDKKREGLDVLVDASGVKSVNDGEYRSTKYGKVKRWKKIHIAIDRQTHRILNIIVTENDIADVEEFSELLHPITERNNVSRVTGDGGYDSERNFKFCDDRNIKPRIPLHINATGKTTKHRRYRVGEQLGIDCRRGRRSGRIPLKERRRKIQEEWKCTSGYHNRSLVETAIGVFKGTFGEYTFSRCDDMKEKELLLKAVVYNTFLI